MSHVGFMRKNRIYVTDDLSTGIFSLIMGFVVLAFSAAMLYGTIAMWGMFPLVVILSVFTIALFGVAIGLLKFAIELLPGSVFRY
jgi:CBS domain containing-hemolysin-like protein